MRMMRAMPADCGRTSDSQALGSSAGGGRSRRCSTDRCSHPESTGPRSCAVVSVHRRWLHSTPLRQEQRPVEALYGARTPTDAA
eukprot:1218527-Pyramimonas_sp.AAC.2